MTPQQNHRLCTAMKIHDVVEEARLDGWDELLMALGLLEDAILKLPPHAKEFAVEKFCAEFTGRGMIKSDFFVADTLRN